MQNRRTLIGLIVIVFLIFLASTFLYYYDKNNSNNNNSNETVSEMPYVILGGFGIYTDYTEESFLYYEHRDGESYTEKNNQDDTIVQFGNFPILSTNDLNFAFSTYNNSSIIAKKILDHKLYSYEFQDHYFMDAITEKSFVKKSSTNAKVCFLDPNTNRGISFGHPISSGKVSGTIFKAEFDKVDDEESPENIYLKKSPVDNPQLVGTITDQLYCGVVFKYDPDYFNGEEYKKIQIARNDEIQLGTAYLYTDYGKGLNMYEVKIVDLTGTMDGYDEEENEVYSSDDSLPFDSEDKLFVHPNKRFGFIITDERLLNDGITYAIGGTSGSPLIQNDKLIGVVCETLYYYNYAYYAESVYQEMMTSYKEENHSYEKTLSKTNHPLVYAGLFPITYYTKSTGAIVSKVSPEGSGIKVGDTILAIDNETFFNNTTLNEAIKNKKESGNEEIELTILRDDKIIEVIVNASEINLESYNYTYLRSGCISMIDPASNRYSAGAAKDVFEIFKPFSGVSVKCSFKRDGSKVLLISTNDVCGTIDSAGYTVYGFLESFNKDDEGLVEIAFKNEVQNSDALILLFSGESELSEFSTEYVTLDCKEDRIEFKLSYDDGKNKSFDDSLLKGAPIYQNGRLVGVFYKTDEKDSSIGYAYYAIDVYNEMMNSK